MVLSENASPVSLMLLGYSLVELKLGSWILIALFMGGLLGLLLSALPLLWGRHSFAAKDRKIRQLEKEINRLTDKNKSYFCSSESFLTNRFVDNGGIEWT